MATRVTRYLSDSGKLFETKLEAAMDDLRFFIDGVVGNTAIAEKFVRDVTPDRLDQLAAITKTLKDVCDAETRETSAAA